MSDSSRNGIPSDVYIPGLDVIRAHICVEDVISHAPCLHFIEEFDFKFYRSMLWHSDCKYLWLGFCFLVLWLRELVIGVSFYR